MNTSEIDAFYKMAAEMDRRLIQNGKLSDAGKMMWAEVLKGVPFREGRTLLVRIYQTQQKSILQPGTVLEAWEALRKERKRLVDTVHSIDRQLAIETDQGVIDGYLARRSEIVAELPAHVVELAGIGQRQLNPPHRYADSSPRRGGRPALDFGKSLKSA